MQLCGTCERPKDNDDDGAHFGNGRLCMDCGFYRSAPKTKTKRIKKPKRADSTADMPTPTDPGVRVPSFD